MSNNKVSIINLDKMLTEMVHRPRIDGYPLYTRVDNLMESGDGTTVTDKGSKWERASKVSYNSPGNIRRLFITHQGVFIHYYAPIVGDKSKSLVQRAKFPIPLNNVLESLMSGEIKYNVKGYGLSILYKPWVCSNIEEVYFDWGILMSQDIANLGMGDLFSMYTGINADKMVDFQPIKYLFESICLKNISNMRERFPRLRCVGYISMLEGIYEAVERDRDRSSSKLWCNNDIVVNAIKDPSITVSIYKLDDVRDSNTKFSIKEGLYLYDRNILKEYQSRFESKIKKQGEKVASTPQSVEDKVKSEVEIKLDDIRAKYGVSVAKMMFNAAVSGLDSKGVHEAIIGMSDEGRSTYVTWIGNELKER